MLIIDYNNCNKGPGISFNAFKNFYNVLFGGADLERAMFYLDTEGRGVNREEFAKIANWVCNQELDPHVVSWHVAIQPFYSDPTI